MGNHNRKQIIADFIEGCGGTDVIAKRVPEVSVSNLRACKSRGYLPSKHAEKLKALAEERGLYLPQFIFVRRT